MICKLCGSLLDVDGNHTEAFKTVYREDGRDKRPNLYRIWANIKERCNNPNQARYKDYGGRGIKLCEEWSTFKPFRAWVLSNGWKHGLQVDRRDNDKGYSPENCRIVTRHEQQQNRRLPNRHKTGKRYARRELTPDDINYIRNSPLTVMALARRFDVHNATISRIKRRLSHKHIPEAVTSLEEQ